jgi:predicted nuclease with TOPRIM domain
VERTCQRCGERFEAKRADKMYCSAACKQAAVRARRGVRVARRPPEPPNDELKKRLDDIEDRQQVLMTDLDHVEGQLGNERNDSALEEVRQRLEELEGRLARLEKAVKSMSTRQREHQVALTRMAELLAAEPWHR